MWIERLEVEGFGCLRDVTLRFNPRVTVVTGLNESGKSTLHAAILAALFGFFDSADRRRERLGLELQDRYEPWDGGRYGVRIGVRRDAAPAVLVQWNFSGRSSFRANDALTGADLTASLRRGAESVISAQELAGVSREFFTRACFVKQGELLALEDTDRTIAKAIESMASSGGRDASAQRALVRLDQAIREEIGKDTARVRPLPMGRRRRDELAQRLYAAGQARAELENLAADATREMHQAELLRNELAQLTAALEGTKLEELQSRIDEIELTQHQLTEHDARLSELVGVASFSTADEAEIVAADGLRIAVLEGLLSVDQDIKERSERVTRLRNELRSAEEELASLAPYEAAPDAPEVERLISIMARMESAQVPEDNDPIVIPNPPPDLLELEATVERERSDLERLHTEAPKGPMVASVCLAVGGVALTGAAGLLAAGLTAAAAVLVLVAVLAGGGWLVARRRPRVDAVTGADGVEELEARRSHAVQVRAAYEREVAELSGRRQEREQRAEAARAQWVSAAAEADELLSDAGYVEADRKAAIARFRHSAQQKTRRSAVAATVQELRSRLADATSRDQERIRLEGEFQAAELRLTVAYDRCGIDEDDLDRARETYDERLRARRRYEGVFNERGRSEQRLRGLLSGQSISDLRLAAAAFEARGVVVGQADPALQGSDLEAKHRLLEVQLADAQQRSSRLSGQLDSALGSLPEPSVLEEELAEVNDHVSTLERARKALLLAHEILEQAAEETYRDIAPRLNEALGRSLGDVTDGRYKEAFVDQEFRVRVRSSEAGRLVDADLLSDGTQEQIYLIQRLELARILGGVESLPMLLDDPLVHCDETRRQALGVLFNEVSTEQQLVVLSTDTAVAELLSETCEECEVVDLDELRAGSVASG